MSLTLQLPTELTERLARLAAEKGVPVAVDALGLLDAAREVAKPVPEFQSSPTADADEDIDPGVITTGAELVAYWRSIGAIGSRPDIPDSLEFSRKTRAEAERRGRPE